MLSRDRILISEVSGWEAQLQRSRVIRVKNLEAIPFRNCVPYPWKLPPSILVQLKELDLWDWVHLTKSMRNVVIFEDPLMQRPVGIGPFRFRCTRCLGFSMFIRIYEILTEIITSEELFDLNQPRLLPPLALTIVRRHLSFIGSQDSELVKGSRCVHYRCILKTLKRPQLCGEKGMMWYLANKFAMHAMSSSKLRLDEVGRSICSGQMFVEVQFFCFEALHENAARFWF